MGCLRSGRTHGIVCAGFKTRAGMVFLTIPVGCEAVVVDLFKPKGVLVQFCVEEIRTFGPFYCVLLKKVLK